MHGLIPTTNGQNLSSQTPLTIGGLVSIPGRTLLAASGTNTAAMDNAILVPASLEQCSLTVLSIYIRFT